jgi:hypothetical protein
MLDGQLGVFTGYDALRDQRLLEAARSAAIPTSDSRPLKTTPVPEPTSVLLIGSGFAATLLRRRRER